MRTVTAEMALKELMKGNERFVRDAMIHPNQASRRRTDLAREQHPFAIVVGCSDSRVPPEVVFDQGLGDIYVVRLAGNVVEREGLGSIEYAVLRYDPPLILVLGHERCGVVEAAVKAGYVPGSLGDIIGYIKPAVIRATAKPGDPVDNVLRAHVALTVERLRGQSEVLAERVRAGRLHIVGARYDLDTGIVEILK
jgi:carbonic anhydrase